MRAESFTPAEEVPEVSVEAYQQFTNTLWRYEHNGEVIQLRSKYHLQVLWMSDKIPPIDGVRLDTLYQLNVVEGGMTDETFYRYCTNPQNHILPPAGSAASVELYKEYEVFRDSWLAGVKTTYESWMQDHGLTTGPGVHIKLFDGTDTKVSVVADFAEIANDYFFAAA